MVRQNCEPLPSSNQAASKFGKRGRRCKSIYDLAEEYLEKKRFSYDHTKAFRVLVRDLARYEAFKNKVLREKFAWNIDKITRKDIEDFENYLRNEKTLSEKYPKQFESILEQYPVEINVVHTFTKLQNRGENTIVKLKKKFKAFMQWLYETERTSNRPFDGIKIGTEKYGVPFYLTKEDFSYEADREIIRKLYKTYICNNEDFDALLEDHSLYWNDDKDIVDSFVLKTIKRFNEKSGADQPLLPQYTSNEDHEFAGKLFRATLENATEIRDIIRKNCKNWEFNRLAFMDVIIMQIALAEIMTFPSIPVNVSFNEYLDIAKIYSTPRSASYINGLLDHVVKTLKKENKLFK